jgi:heme-degrading monooxygenase HmoA
MVVVVFRSKLRPDLGRDVIAEAGKRGARMYELAARMPGFVSYKEFTASDGENVSLVEFETQEQSRAWRDEPEHKETQAWGRERVFAEYRIQVCEVARVTSFAL